jgi:hypothetical protein
MNGLDLLSGMRIVDSDIKQGIWFDNKLLMPVSSWQSLPELCYIQFQVSH